MSPPARAEGLGRYIKKDEGWFYYSLLTAHLKGNPGVTKNFLQPQRMSFDLAVVQLSQFQLVGKLEKYRTY